MGVNSEDSLDKLIIMNTLIIASLLAFATAFPIEDTPEVAEAKATFNAAFAAAEKGEHAALAPVNNDAQAEQIATAYLSDAEEVAAAKAAFQAAAPVHVIPEPAPLAAAPAPAPAVLPGFPYGVSALNAVGAYPYNLALPAALPAPVLPKAALTAAALPAALPATLPYAGLPFAGYPFGGFPLVAAPAKAE